MSKLASTTICLLLILTKISQATAYYEWTSWTGCAIDCGGDRTRNCYQSNRAGLTKDECPTPNVAAFEQCTKENCDMHAAPTTHGGTTDFVTDPTTSTASTINTKDCQCGCLLNNDKGRIQTQIQSESICTWNFETEHGNLIMITIESSLENFDWKQGGMYVASPKEIIAKYQGKQGGIDYQKMRHKIFKSIGNRMNLTVFSHSFTSNSKMFGKIGFKFTYITFPDPKKTIVTKSPQQPGNNDGDDEKESSGGGGMNVPLVASIIACVVVIIIASAFLVYRKKQRSSSTPNKHNREGEKTGFFGGGKDRRLPSPRKDRTKVMMDNNGEPMVEMSNNPRDTDVGYMSGGEMFIPTQQPMSGGEMFIPTQQPTYITALAPATYIAGQQYINWPLPGFSQSQLTAAYTQSYEQITPTTNAPVPPMYYKSSGES